MHNKQLKKAKKTEPKFLMRLFIFRYFRAMSKGETPPVTERLEMPVATQKTDSGLTPGLLRVLNKQVRFMLECF